MFEKLYFIIVLLLSGRRKSIEQAHSIMEIIKKRGVVTKSDFRALVHSCPALLELLKNYLFASSQEVFDIVKKGGLNAKVLIDLYESLPYVQKIK